MYKILLTLTLSIYASEITSLVEETITKTKALNADFAGFDCESPDVSKYGATLQELCKIMQPISLWLSDSPRNFNEFLTKSELTNLLDASKIDTDIYKIIKNLTISRKILDHKIYDAAIVHANSKYPSKDYYDSYDEDLYLWVVQYISKITDLNQILGEPVWKVKYAGNIDGVFYPEGETITEEQVQCLVEQFEIKRRINEIKNSVEKVYCYDPVSTYSFHHTTFEPCYGLVNPAFDTLKQLSVRVFCESLGVEKIVVINLDPEIDNLLLMYPTTLEDNLAGVHQIGEKTGRVISEVYEMDDSNDNIKFYNRDRALDYLVQINRLPPDLKLPLALAINNCF